MPMSQAYGRLVWSTASTISSPAQAPSGNRTIDACHYVVGNDPPSARQALKLAHGRRFPDIEKTEQNEGGQHTFPVDDGRGGDGDPLSDDLVYHDDAGVLASFDPRHHTGR